MRIVALLLSTAAFGWLLGASPANAQNYPWCAQYMGGTDGGVTNCGFVSYAQCMETARGAGAYCERNSMYRPAVVAPPPRRKHVRPVPQPGAAAAPPAEDSHARRLGSRWTVDRRAVAGRQSGCGAGLSL